MRNESSLVTALISRIRSGDQQAFEELWTKCWKPAVIRTKKLLSRRFRTVSDEEDLASVVLENILLRIQSGGFPSLIHGNQLWKLLWVSLERKVANHCEYHLANRRSIFSTVHMSSLQSPEASASDHEAKFLGSNATPMETIALTELLAQLTAKLDMNCCRTLHLALDGYSPKEIAISTNTTVWTVYGRLADIRKKLEQERNERMEFVP